MCTGCSWNTFLPGWELHSQEPTEGEQGECIVRGQGSAISADHGLEAAELGRGKQPGNMNKGPWGVVQAPAHFSLSPELWSTQNLIDSKVDPFNLQSPGCGRKVGGSSFLEKDSKVHGCPGKTDQFHIADHLTLSPLSSPAAVSQPRGQRHRRPQGLQLLRVIPQAPNSEQGAECSVGLHGIQSETALGLSGRPRWPEAPCGKTISHLAAHRSFPNIRSAG